MKTGVIILARLSSTRLPAKGLINLKGVPVIAHIIEATAQVVPKEHIVVATSTDSTDDPLCQFLSDHKISYYRGSLDNVSKRFHEASEQYGFDYSIRINGDNVFLDVKLLNKVVSLLATNRYDFISNVKKRTFPKGMSIEAISMRYYSSEIERIISDVYHREHVMSWIYELDTANHLYLYNEKCPDAAGVQLALDTEKDLERTIRIMDQMTKPIWKYEICEIYSILKRIQI